MGDSSIAVVIDNGSGSCKAGFAGEEAPKILVPTKVGRPRSDVGLNLKDYYVGEDALSNRAVLVLNNPIERGIITNWEDMEKLWQHSFSKLDVSPKDHPVLLTDIPNNPKINREKMTQIMFEAFHTPTVSITIQGVLSLYATGCLTGLVFDSGADVSQIVPVNNGYAISNATKCLALGGRDLNVYLMKILTENGASFNYQNAIKEVCEMKEKFCYIALDYKQEMEKAIGDPNFGEMYKLPDDHVVTFGSEQFRCPEALFQPSFLDEEFDGIHQACYE